MQPVVRREDGAWMLESGIEPARDADFECDLETFHTYFGETYSDDDYTPSDTDGAEFVEIIGNNRQRVED